MSDTKQDGGPAFARPYSEIALDDGHRIGIDPQEGLSLRDYFAVRALVGMLAFSGDEEPPEDNDLARSAYALADAMLVERAKR